MVFAEHHEELSRVVVVAIKQTVQNDDNGKCGLVGSVCGDAIVKACLSHNGKCENNDGATRRRFVSFILICY